MHRLDFVLESGKTKQALQPANELPLRVEAQSISGGIAYLPDAGTGNRAAPWGEIHLDKSHAQSR
jgi:hypothetical protein